MGQAAIERVKAGPARPIVERSPPVRPPLTSALSSPLEHLDRPTPTALKVSVTAWFLSAAAGVTAGAYFGTRLDEIRAGVTTAVRAEDPTLTDSSASDLVDTTMILAFSALAAPVVLAGVFILLMLTRRYWARAVLTLVAIATIPSIAVGFAILSVEEVQPPDWAIGAALGQLGLIVVAVFTMFLPSANRWFHERRATMRRK